MREIQVTQYQAEDGKIFKSKEKCLKHEEELLQIDKILEMIPIVKKICADHNCSTCPFRCDSGSCRFGYLEYSSISAMPYESWIS